jgi:hypothetical protein
MRDNVKDDNPSISDQVSEKPFEECNRNETRNIQCDTTTQPVDLDLKGSSNVVNCGERFSASFCATTFQNSATSNENLQPCVLPPGVFSNTRIIGDQIGVFNVEIPSFLSLVRYIFILLPISVSYSKQLTPFS